MHGAKPGMKVAASWGCCRIRAAVLVIVSLVESCRRLERDGSGPVRAAVLVIVLLVESCRRLKRDGSGPVAADARRELVDVFAS
jgi:hypothetical protein